MDPHMKALGVTTNEKVKYSLQWSLFELWKAMHRLD